METETNKLTAAGRGNGLPLSSCASSLEAGRKIALHGNPAGLANFFRVRAFTLIELLVAMTVLSLLVVMLMGLVDSTTKLWRDNEGRVDSYREARAAMSIISRDLNNIISTSNTNYFLVDKPVNGAVRDTNIASTLFFLTALPRSAQWATNTNYNISDVCEVGYFLADATLPGASNSFRARKTRNLYRYFKGSDDTFPALTNTNQNMLFANVSPLVNEAQLLARNVREFRIEAYTNAATNTNMPTTWERFSSSAGSPIPKLLKITIVAVNQDLAQKLDPADWTDTNVTVLKQSMQTFKTHVMIPDPR